MTLSQVNGGGKMENEDLGVKVVAPRVLLPYYFRPSICILIVFFFFLNFTQNMIIHLVVHVIPID